MLGAVQSKGVDWWGYTEGESLSLSIAVAALALLAIAYLGQRFWPRRQTPPPKARRQRS